MSQNQEIIEAKLCAYIDGELDPEGRAEIEKHLEANPQHRRLLESLKATRDLVRWLPRESAPSELAETLNGQLERSVLLDYDGDSLRPRILPRVFAAAAIVVLTAGLAAAVYFALPKSHRNATQIASTNSLRGTDQGHSSESATAPSEPRDVLKESDSNRNSTERLSKAGLPMEAMLAKRGVSDAAKTGDVELDTMAHEVAANSDSIVAEANGLAPAARRTAPLSNSVVMLVRSDKPDAAQKQVTQYLTSNQIAWRSAEPLEQANDALALKDRTPANEAAAVPTEAPAQQNQIYANTAPATTAPSNGVAQRQEQAGRAQAQQPVLAQQAPAQQNQIQQAVASPSYLTNSAVSNSSNARANGLYVARMSRSQAQALTVALNQGPQQAAQVRDVSEGIGAMPPAGDELRSSAAAGGLGAAGGQTTQPAQATGGASMRTDLRVAGEITQQASLQGATTRPAERSGEMPLDQKKNLEPAAQTAPPTTQPAATEPGVAIAPAEEPLNVVIVVEPNAEAQAPTKAAAAALATQPAVPALAQPAPTTGPTTQPAPAR